MGMIERKLYKVLRNVGVKKNFIRKANSIDDLYLDNYDQKLLVYYFENEFQVKLTDKQIRKLVTLKAVGNYVNQKKI
jgi:acyl carrier protein